MSRIMLFCMLAVPFAWGAAAAADEDDVDTFDRTPVDCVALSRVRRTEVVDGRTILFYMRGGAIYRTHLPNECPGLEREGRFMYRTTGGQLCQIDTITVLERFGVGFDRGFTCRLGQFYPMTAEEIEELRHGPADVQAIPVDPDDEDEPPPAED